jgi:AmiR/NasT family two-component response regulator
MNGDKPAGGPLKVLLFITDDQANLKVVTSFLKKRNFTVHIESDVKDAVASVFDLKPDFIFIDWNHSDRKIQMLPKILSSTGAIVVPFVNRNTKEAVFKFDQCPYSPKLYPPLSGPSVERVIMKSTKEDADFLEKVRKFKDNESKAAMAQAQRKLMEADLSEIPITDDLHEAPPPIIPQEKSGTAEAKSSVAIDENEIKENLEQRNSILDEEKSPLTEEQKKNLHQGLQDQVTPSLENALSVKDVTEKTGKAPGKHSAGKNTFFFKSEVSAGGIKGSLYISRGTPKVKKPVREKPLLQDVSSEEQDSVESETSLSADDGLYYVHCISIICPGWCGYFLISSKYSLDFGTIDLVFSDWIKSQMKNLDEITERDYFNFENVPEETVTEIQKMADYSEKMTANGQEYTVSFFAVEPKDMKIDFSSDKNYIEVYTRDIPPQAALDFDLLLHLPENQKYLLFTLKEMALTEDQRSRLLSRNVTKLFTKLENEYEFRKFLAMKTFSRLFEIINNRLAGS